MKIAAYRILLKMPRMIQHFVYRLLYKPQFGKGVVLYGWSIFSSNVRIGDYSYLKPNNFMRNVTVGKFCCIADNFSVGLNEHPYHDFSSYSFTGLASPVRSRISGKYHAEEKMTIIGNDVWIGQDVIVKSGVTIGNGAVIGARSVVTKDVPPYAVVAGVPARIIKYRFEQDKIDLLQKLKWWDWDLEDIVGNLDRLHSFDNTLLSEP